MLEQDVLLDLLARKDNRAYQYLYQCYYVALKALANYYVKDNDVAEDLVQDVFISLLESGYKFKTENDIKYFLYSSLKTSVLVILGNRKSGINITGMFCPRKMKRNIFGIRCWKRMFMPG